MKITRTQLLSLGLVVAGFAVAAALYGRLPDSVPTHWNARGVADGFTPKPWGPFVLPTITGAVYLLLVIVARISPRGYRVDRFQSVFEVIQLALVAFLFWLQVLTLLASMGTPVPMDRALYAGLGLLFVVLGNFMGKLTKNFFIGIRTPWTLSSDEVWLRTHRLGGKLFVLAGIGLFLSSFVRAGSLPLALAVAIAAGIPVVYSYFLYRRIEGFKASPDSSHHSS